MKILLGDDLYIENNKIIIASNSLHKFAQLTHGHCPIKYYKYKFDFGQYLNKNYFKESFKTRPISFMNKFRKENSVRELEFISKDEIYQK